MPYRLFIDEVGHDHLKSSNTPQERHLCLMGVILNGRGHWDLRQRMDALKVSTFGRADIVLHRREIIDQGPPFDVLRNQDVRAKFDQGLIDIIRDCPYTAIAVLIDKQDHMQKYRVWKYPAYHYCLHVMIERYVMWLKERNAKGDVVIEWRGINPNKRLEESYTRLYSRGDENVNVSVAEMQAHLSSSQIKIEKKEANTAGLQLADLLASPTSRYLICRRTNVRMTAPFGREVIKILYKHKFRRGPKNRIEGYGIKVLP